MGWQEKAAKAKKGHRPSLRNWERDGIAETFPPYAEALLNSDRPYQSFEVVGGGGGACGGQRYGPSHQHGTDVADVVERSLPLEAVIGADGRGRGEGGAESDVGGGTAMYPAVLDAARTPPRVFHERYEARCIPTVIRDIPYGVRASDHGGPPVHGDAMMMEEEKKECDGVRGCGRDSRCDGSRRSSDANAQWPAVRRWTLDALYDDPDLSDRPLKCGEDDDGYTIRMKLRYFIEYLRHNRDDSPLYIFDATFDEDRLAKRILDDYNVPDYFDEDLLGLVGERRRPPYRWFLVGPQRSGTTVHIDPLGTSAWNTLVHGTKRWVLFPPHVPKSVAKGRGLVLRGEDDEAVHYFTTILPRIKRRAAAGGGRGEHAGFACYEFTQRAGETVFVPHGWWHAVLNVTHTVGITQNYCSRRNFDEVWKRTRSGRKKMACSWLRRLGERHPDLERRARELNRRDGFVMWEDDPEEQRRWREKRAEKERKKRERRERKARDREGKRKEKKERWGEHRTAERKRGEDEEDAVRNVSPSLISS